MGGNFFFNFLKRCDKRKLKKILNKQNIFFKKVSRQKIVLSKRLSLVLKKRKGFGFKKKKINLGKFFFKKFFYKTIMGGRKLIKNFFFLNSKVRQKNITKTLIKHNNVKFKYNNPYEYSIMNILLRGHFFLTTKDVLFALKNGFIFLNGSVTSSYKTQIGFGDCIQVYISKNLYKYCFFFKKLLKKKAALYKYNAWLFFKHNFIKKKAKVKGKKRKNPNYLYLFFLFKLNIPIFLEICFLTMSIFFLKKPGVFEQNTYFFSKFFSFKFFNLYNFKKIN